MTRYSILKPGYNCWRVASARRVAYLIDAADYFRAFYFAAARTTRSLLMLGWDIDSRVPLLRDGETGPLPIALGEYLNALVSRPNGPQAYVLTWDFAMLYALDREWLPIYKLDWRTHRRLHFRMDGNHPPGGCHHQKVVVLDDTLAFVGGLDLTHARWDTIEHRPDDPRRVDNGVSYRPFHDMQVMVDGVVAGALGDLARERWQRTTGRRLPALSSMAHDLWPAQVPVDVENVQIAIARTDPAHNSRAEVREVELLYGDAIRAAQRHIYIENQFFTANSIADAFIERLQEPDGPEIVMVLALCTDGWLSQQTMDVLRDRLLNRLRAADRYGRLRAYYPDVDGLGQQCINVHSKVMVVDDEFARIGSANLNNRSMGIDTECDLAFESGGERRVRRGIARLRERLLAEHLGTSTERVAQALTRRGSLIAAIESLRGTNRHTLKEIPVPAPDQIVSWLPKPELLDPERPIDPDKIAAQFIPMEERAPAHRRLIISVTMLMLVVAFAAAWHWTPLSHWLDAQTLSSYIVGFRHSPSAPFVGIGAFILGGLLAFPVTLLVVVTVLAFGPVQGIVYSFIGSLLSAWVVYGIGHMLGRHTIRRFAGSRLNRLSCRLAERGVLAVTLVRLLPVAPFTVVNLVAGASHIGLRDFLLGTVLGMIPGILAIVLFIDRVDATLQQPGVGTGLGLGVIIVLLFGMIYGLRRWLLRRQSVGSSS
ncbi:MAG: VTT domain-containing protein [Gammaproteobacteria bacterium]|nr:VTT domain-containing protein [Gammaproteobacteria bacterium]